MNERMGPRYILKDAHQISQLELYLPFSTNFISISPFIAASISII